MVMLFLSSGDWRSQTHREGIEMSMHEPNFMHEMPPGILFTCKISMPRNKAFKLLNGKVFVRHDGFDDIPD